MPAFRKNEHGRIEVARSWESLVERKIQDAVDQGVFDVSARGRRVDTPKNPYEGDREAANRLMKDADCTPRWISLGQEVDAEIASLDVIIEEARLKIRSGMKNMAKLDLGDAAHERVRLRGLRDDLRRRFLDEVARVNGKILTYNLSVPVIGLEKFRLPRDEQAERFNRLVPDIPSPLTSR